MAILLVITELIEQRKYSSFINLDFANKFKLQIFYRAMHNK